MNRDFAAETRDPVADFIQARRPTVARQAAVDLRNATDDLPGLLHRLAGTLASFGFNEASDELRAILGDIRRGATPDSVMARIVAVSAALEAEGV